MSSVIKEKGYDVVATAKWYEEFYQSTYASLS